MIYQKHGKIWSWDFRFHGRRYLGSTHTESKREAEQIERAFRTNLARGLVGIEEKPKPQRRTVGDLLDLLWADYELRGKASKWNRSLFNIVRNSFGARMADSITDEDVTQFITRSRRKGAADNTLHNKLQILRQAFDLAKLTPPVIPELKGSNVRTGFLLPAQFDAVYAHLPEDLKDFALFGYLTGWRCGAIKKLQWPDVREGFIHLRRENSKNRRPYQVPLVDEVAELIQRRQKSRGFCPFVFHRDGKPVNAFRKSWDTACEKAGCPGTLFHDMRRSAARNLIHAGVPQAVAMCITGHETTAMFTRYNIVSPDDLNDAMKKLASYSTVERKKVVSIAG